MSVCCALQSTPVGSLTHEVPSPHRGGDDTAAAGGKRQADTRGQANRVRNMHTHTPPPSLLFTSW